jgi:hypothetical protein
VDSPIAEKAPASATETATAAEQFSWTKVSKHCMCGVLHISTPSTALLLLLLLLVLLHAIVRTICGVGRLYACTSI